MLAVGSTLVLAMARPEAALAQAAAPPSVTRGVQVFAELEESLLQAIRRHDGARIDALLGEDFEMTVAQDPDAPVAREDWVASVRRPGAGAYAAQQMAVREADSVAIASFVLRPMPARRNAAPVFVVDTWQRVGTQWRLTARYAAPVAGSRRSIPGDAKPTTIRKQI